jgi:hypothetical protein
LFNLFGVRESLWLNKWFNYFTHPFFDDWLSIDYTTICQIYQMVFWTTAPTAFFRGWVRVLHIPSSKGCLYAW